MPSPLQKGKAVGGQEARKGGERHMSPFSGISLTVSLLSLAFLRQNSVLVQSRLVYIV